MPRYYLGLLFVIAVLLLPPQSIAREYDCTVTAKATFGRSYSPEQVESGQFSAQLEETSAGVFISRCGFSASAGEITCDRQRMDRVVRNELVLIKKYYHFASQSSFQLFPSLKFIDDNGRGGIQYGKCRPVSP